MQYIILYVLLISTHLTITNKKKGWEAMGYMLSSLALQVLFIYFLIVNSTKVLLSALFVCLLVIVCISMY